MLYVSQVVARSYAACDFQLTFFPRFLSFYTPSPYYPSPNEPAFFTSLHFLCYRSEIDHPFISEKKNVFAKLKPIVVYKGQKELSV